jgi:hypothetical protein
MEMMRKKFITYHFQPAIPICRADSDSGAAILFQRPVQTHFFLMKSR